MLSLAVSFVLGVAATVVLIRLAPSIGSLLTRPRNDEIEDNGFSAAPEITEDPLIQHMKDRFRLDPYDADKAIAVVEEVIARAKKRQAPAQSPFLEQLLTDLDELRSTAQAIDDTLKLDIDQVLNIDAFHDDLTRYLRDRLEEKPDRIDASQLMTSRWTQALLRADALASVYLSETSAHNVSQLLRLPVTILRHDLGRNGIVVDDIRLLSAEPPKGAELIAQDRNELSSYPSIRSRVQGKVQRVSSESSLIIDCIFVGFRDTRRSTRRVSRIIVYNPSEWSR